ncbi:MAG: Arm DNA-binding domain-containing protein [Candidatus Kapaibacterium sp.]
MRKRINFTKATLLSLKPPAPGKRLVVWDTKVQGLQCRISGKGVKTFSLYRRLKNGRPVRVTLGKLGDMTVEQARAQATLVNAAIAKGKTRRKRAVHIVKRSPLVKSTTTTWKTMRSQKGFMEK